MLTVFAFLLVCFPLLLLLFFTKLWFYISRYYYLNLPFHHIKYAILWPPLLDAMVKECITPLWSFTTWSWDWHALGTKKTNHNIFDISLLYACLQRTIIGWKFSGVSWLWSAYTKVSRAWSKSSWGGFHHWRSGMGFKLKWSSHWVASVWNKWKVE